MAAAPRTATPACAGAPGPSGATTPSGATAFAGGARTSVIDPLADVRWAQLVDATPDASIFHHPAWLELLRQQYGYEMLACCAADATGALRAGLPLALIESRLTGRRLVALPFSDVCPPLGAQDPAGAELPAALEALGRVLGVGVQVRGPLPGALGGGGVGKAGEVYHQHLVALERDVDAVRRRFTRGSVMQGVRRAQRQGVTVERRTDAQALRTFYGLHLQTRRRQGIPTQPRSFIDGFAGLFERGLGFVSIASVDGQPAAAAVFLVFNGVITYKYGASDRCYLDRRPNNLLFMDAIEWACGEGLRTLDLGRTDSGHESLRTFKLLWGAEELELRYTHLGDASPGGGREAPEALQRLIRTAPAFVGRGLGTLLYRHVG